MLRFRRMHSLQRFVAVPSSVTNHFNADRSLSSRLLYKEARTAAVSEEPLERGEAPAQRGPMTQRSPFRYIKTSPEVIRLAALLCVGGPESLRNVEDLLHEREQR